MKLHSCGSGSDHQVATLCLPHLPFGAMQRGVMTENTELNQGSPPIGSKALTRKKRGDALRNENVKLIKKHGAGL